MEQIMSNVFQVKCSFTLTTRYSWRTMVFWSDWTLKISWGSNERGIVYLTKQARVVLRLTDLRNSYLNLSCTLPDHVHEVVVCKLKYRKTSRLRFATKIDRFSFLQAYILIPWRQNNTTRKVCNELLLKVTSTSPNLKRNQMARKGGSANNASSLTRRKVVCILLRSCNKFITTESW